VLLLGLSQSVEREGLDRVNITLPGVQDEFAQQILGLGKPTAVVLINGGAIAIESLKANAPAIVEAFYPGYWGGVAIADVIFGDYNPGGKLPYTIYSKDFVNQVNFLSMNMTDPPGRTYRYYTGTPLYEFGYGLSYTTFSLKWTSDPKIQVLLTSDRESQVNYTVQVTNTGKIAGDEVVLAYFQPNTTQPLLKQLFGFQRVHLDAGQSTTISFMLGTETLKIGNQDGDLVVSPGSYNIILTNGVEAMLSTEMYVKGSPLIYEKYPFPK